MLRHWLDCKYVSANDHIQCICEYINKSVHSFLIMPSGVLTSGRISQSYTDVMSSSDRMHASSERRVAAMIVNKQAFNSGCRSMAHENVSLLEYIFKQLSFIKSIARLSQYCYLILGYLCWGNWRGGGGCQVYTKQRSNYKSGEGPGSPKLCGGASPYIRWNT